jgi:uncharacterized protein YaeQ
MALRATVYKAELEVSDLDRSHFRSTSLSLARHPSETEERLLVRLLAFALHDDEHLAFGRGISSDDEATIWLHDLTGVIRLWVEVGLPDERVLRRACGRADRVVLYTYGGRTAAQWWDRQAADLARLDNLAVFELPVEVTQALAARADRNLSMQVTIQEGTAWVSLGGETITVQPLVRKAFAD